MSRYAFRLADDYNAVMARDHPARADEIEWYVTPLGNLALRDRAGWSERRAVQMDHKREAERQTWLRKHGEGQFTIPTQDRMGWPDSE